MTDNTTTTHIEKMIFAAKQEGVKNCKISVEILKRIVDLCDTLRAEIKSIKIARTFFHNLTIEQKQTIDNQEAEIERLRKEIKEKTETIDFLKARYTSMVNEYCKYKEENARAKEKVLDEYAEKLKKKSTRAINCCTFDSVICADYVDKYLNEIKGD